MTIGGCRERVSDARSASDGRSAGAVRVAPMCVQTESAIAIPAAIAPELTFPRRTKLKPGETVIFSWITVESRAHRDHGRDRRDAEPSARTEGRRSPARRARSTRRPDAEDVFTGGTPEAVHDAAALRTGWRVEQRLRS